MLKTLAFLAALTACVDQLSTSSFESSLDTSCVPLAPVDGDNREMLQAAIDAGCGRLGPGVYSVGANPNLSNRAALTLGPGQSLVGSGALTVLMFQADVHGYWIGLRMSGDESSLADISLDSSDMITTDEQSHLIEVHSASRVSIERTWLRHPKRFDAAGIPQRGGDCVRVLAATTEAPAGASIIGNHFVSCDRSGVAIQRNTHRLVVSGNVFYETGDAAIDAEMTGTGIGGDWALVGNIAIDAPVHLAGTGYAERVLFADNVLNGGGLDLYNVRSAIISGNTIVQRKAGPALKLTKSVDDIHVTNNIISREHDSTQAVISASHHNSGNPGRLTFAGNTLRNIGPGAPVNLQSTEDVIFVGNRVQGSATTAINIQGVSRSTEAAVVSANLFRGTFTVCVKLTNVIASAVSGNLGCAGI